MGSLRAGGLAGFYAGVTVSSVTPAYFAVDEDLGRVTVLGEGFSEIESGALAWVSQDNNNPLQFYDQEADVYKYDVEVVSDNELLLIPKHSSRAVRNTYIGVIASPDREKVYWLNNTNPLP